MAEPNLVSQAMVPKLKELLHSLNSAEIKISSYATKEFIKLLKGENGAALLRLYVQSSSNFIELVEAWKLWQGKPGMLYILKLISTILSHPDGKYKPNDRDRIGFSRAIDKFSRTLLQEKLDDVYKEFNSKEGKRQNSALLLLASIARRGSVLASEVAKSFDFKIQGFTKLADHKEKQGDKKKKYSTRKAFVGFAMSFLEVGKPGLLRWVLQQKEMYFGVFRGLDNDDDDTVVDVLSTLRDRVLVEESLIPPGLRSVLFGSITLEKLVSISGRDDGGRAAELAHNVLLMVCTEPCNGLMPDLKRHPNPLRGNPNRLLMLMKKLRGTEIDYHRDLLLSMLRGRPSLASRYMDEFPYNLEDYASSTWFATVSLAADVVSSVGVGCPFDFLNSNVHHIPPFDSAEVQNIMKCICPRPFTRSIINKGLLHSDFLVKHGTLRILLEILKLLNTFITAFNSCSCSSIQRDSVKQEIQNEAKVLLPDFQVLLTLLSSLGGYNGTPKPCLKRKLDLENGLNHCSKSKKKSRKTVSNEDTDIVLGGIGSASNIFLPQDSGKDQDTHMKDELDAEKEFLDVVSNIWAQHLGSGPVNSLDDAEIYFHTKLLEALKIYLRTVHNVLEGSFDFFMNLLSNPLALHTDLQKSLLSLLNEYIGWSPQSGIPTRTPTMMYKYLSPFISLLIFSPISEIKDLAYDLAKAAMLSSGAFDRNLSEIGAWILFLPGYGKAKSSVKAQELGQSSTVVISFLCDAISTVGNNLFKYWDTVRSQISLSKCSKGVSPDFSPLVLCILQKCIRLLSSESKTYSLPEKSMISLYVCNTLKYVLQTQVDAELPSFLIHSILSGTAETHSAVFDDSLESCEWRPLKTLLLFSQNLVHQTGNFLLSTDTEATSADTSFSSTLDEVKLLARSARDDEMAGIIKAFSSAMLCTTSNVILMNFPSVITMCQALRGTTLSQLLSFVLLEQTFVVHLAKLWPDLFKLGLCMAVSESFDERKEDDVPGSSCQSSIDDRITCNMNFDGTQSAASAFCFFLKQAPFHVLFPAIMSRDMPSLLELPKLKDLLLVKLSECANDCRISYLRLILSWFYQIRSSYVIKPLAALEELSNVCLILVNSLLHRGGSTDNTVLQFAEDKFEVAHTIFCHPIVIVALTFPLSCNDTFAEEDSEVSLEAFVALCRQRIHDIDHHVLDLLVMTCDSLLSYADQFTPKPENGANKLVKKAFNALTQRLLVVFKKKLDLSVQTDCLTPLLQAFYAIHTLTRFIAPFDFVKLVDWIFIRFDNNELYVQRSGKLSALSVGFCVAGDVFESLCTYLLQPVAIRAQYGSFWEMKNNCYNGNFIEETYSEVCKFASKFEVDFAYICMLKAATGVYRLRYSQNINLHPLSLTMSRVITRTPLDIVSHCIHRTNKTRAKLLFLLVELSSLHMSVFGHSLLGLMNGGDILFTDTSMEGASFSSLTDEDSFILLPCALSYLNSVFGEFERKYCKHFIQITSFYSEKLLKGFQNWKSFAYKKIFEEEYDKIFVSSTEELLSLVDDSLLGKAVNMLRYHFALNGGSIEMKKRLKIFNSIFSSRAAHDELLDGDFNDAGSCSFNVLVNAAIRIASKVSLSKMILFPEDSQVQSPMHEADNMKGISLQMGSPKENSCRMRFMSILVGAWQLMVKKSASIPNGSVGGNDTACLCLYTCLEDFFLRNLLELTTKMHHSLVELESIPFIEQLFKSSLIFRFKDPKTLEKLRNILSLLLEGKLLRIPYLQLLLSHSQFGSSIQSISQSSTSHSGELFRPMSSILGSLVIARPDTNAIKDNSDFKAPKPHLKQLEIIKLLSVLICTKPNQCSNKFGEDSGICLKELQLLLLSSYGATLCERDLEIHKLMNEIELIDESQSATIEEMDYLWGTALFRIRKEHALEQGRSTIADADAFEERRKSQFRENLQVDPKICANTVLCFPYKRSVMKPPFTLSRLQESDDKDVDEAQSPKKTQIYDPVFILRLSIHCLSAGYVEPVEFAGLGLLAVAFISMSSVDVEMRKLGYETLGRYKNALEMCQKNKDARRIQLLLAYVQNGIEEPWQRIPSFIAVFAAETSMILLDSSHQHYPSLSNLMLHSSRVNLKGMSLFRNFFSSTSVNFRKERLWILRLAYAGLNLEDDAHIYIRNSILELLLSFYSSPLADNETKELILQIVRKSVKLHKTARYLVEQCGLLSFLSSVLLTITGMLHEVEKSFLMRQLVVISEVVADVLSSRNIIEWLQRCALEQLMEISLHLHRLLTSGLASIKDNILLVDLILQIISSTLKISQKRKMYQPHFTLSLEGIIEIYEATVQDSSRASTSAELGLKAILMSTPPADIIHMDQERLSSFLLWGTSTALISDSKSVVQPKVSYTAFALDSEVAPSDESLISKFLRWLVAAVILGKLSCKVDALVPLPKIYKRENSKNLESLMEFVEESSKNSDSRELLAAEIYYLQQLLGVRCRVLPSVVSALSLLLPPDISACAGSTFTHMRTQWSKIQYPAEAVPTWRWTYYQAWKDLLCEQSDLEKIDEVHACKTLLLTFSVLLGKNQSDTQFLTHQDLDNSGLFQWERSIVETA